MTAYFSLPSSPCTTNQSTISVPATPTIDFSMMDWNITTHDKISKRLGGKDMTMHEINKLRYKGRR